MTKAYYSSEQSLSPKAHRVSTLKERERNNALAESSYGRKLQKLDDLVAMLEEGRFEESGMDPTQLQMHVNQMMEQFQRNCI